MTLSNEPPEIRLGDRVRCRLTGFEGIAVVISTWLHGCVRVGVQPEILHEGLPRDPVHFDLAQLERTKWQRDHIEAQPSVGAPAAPTTVAVPPGGPAREGRGFQR